MGTYPILAAQGTLAAQDYTFRFVNGTLTVTQEVVTVDSDQGSLAASSNVAYVIGADADVAVGSPVTLASGGLVTVQNSVLSVPGIISQPGAAASTLMAAPCRRRRISARPRRLLSTPAAARSTPADSTSR